MSEQLQDLVDEFQTQGEADAEEIGRDDEGGSVDPHAVFSAFLDRLEQRPAWEGERRAEQRKAMIRCASPRFYGEENPRHIGTVWIPREDRAEVLESGYDYHAPQVWFFEVPASLVPKWGYSAGAVVYTASKLNVMPRRNGDGEVTFPDNTDPDDLLAAIVPFKTKGQARVEFARLLSAAQVARRQKRDAVMEDALADLEMDGMG